MLDGVSEPRLQALAAAHPIGRLGRAEEVVELVVWLSGDCASFVTGECDPIAGGYLAKWPGDRCSSGGSRPDSSTRAPQAFGELQRKVIN